MDLEFGEQEIKIKLRVKGERKFRLIEHTQEQFDEFLEKVTVIFDRAIAEMRKLAASGLRPETQLSTIMELKDLKKQVADKSAELVAELLEPVNGEQPVDGTWVRQNVSWRMRERIMDIQHELNGVEVVKDQGFLVEKALLQTRLSLEIQMKFGTPPPSNLMTESESSLVSVIETLDPSDHVSVDDLETEDAGLLLH